MKIMAFCSNLKSKLCSVIFFGVFGTYVFRLSALYLILFVFFSTIVINYISWNSVNLLEHQLVDSINSEVIDLNDIYKAEGEDNFISTIERRGRHPGSFIYVFVDDVGDSITGNALLRKYTFDGEVDWSEIEFVWPSEPYFVRLAKLRVFMLPNGLKLLVGRDLEERERLQDVMNKARIWSILIAFLFGGVGGFFSVRRVLRRTSIIANASERLLSGDLQERLPVFGNKDEFDRLSSHINYMLDRIELLMRGLKELSDHVAHELRTPLTRLRANAEQNLRKATSVEEAKRGLEKAIDESDKLIHIFDALMMIARAESGSLKPDMEVFQLKLFVEDMVDFYAPLAHDAGMSFSISLNDVGSVLANRALLGRALSNIIENSIKYGKPTDNSTKGEILLSIKENGDFIEIVIQDKGQGIKKDDLTRAMERFVRLDNGKVEGAGLGLSLVRSIMKMHGGDIKFEDASVDLSDASVEKSSSGLRVVLTIPKVKL